MSVDKSEIINNFFDLEKECPPEMVDCERIRNEYNEDIKKLENMGVCTSCLKRSLRNKYITYILATNPNLS